MQTTHPAAPLHAARPVAPSCPDRVSVLPRNGFSQLSPFAATSACGPCCSLDRDGLWGGILLGVHASALDEVPTADYWVSIHVDKPCPETGLLFTEEYVVRLTVGAAVGLRRPKIQDWVSEHFPGGAIHDYCLWGDWPEFRNEMELPF